MSAYIVDDFHIVYLVAAGMCRSIVRYHGSLSWVWDIDRTANTYERATLPVTDYGRAAEVANMLWAENVRSVAARYPNDKTVGDLPGDDT